MSALLLPLAWLLMVWLVLLESTTLGAVLSGVTVCAVVFVVFRPRQPAPVAFSVRPIAVVVFLGSFAKALIWANLLVAVAVVRPTGRWVRPAIVAVPVVDTSDAQLAILAGTLSLTPGMTVIEMRRRDPVLYVHVLYLTSVDGVRREVLERQRMLTRALGRAETLHAVDERLRVLRTRADTKEKPR